MFLEVNVTGGFIGSWVRPEFWQFDGSRVWRREKPFHEQVWDSHLRELESPNGVLAYITILHDAHNEGEMEKRQVNSLTMGIVLYYKLKYHLILSPQKLILAPELVISL